MFSKSFKVCVYGLSAFLLAACQTQTIKFEPAPEFLVDDRQSQELTQIVRSVRQQLSRLKFVSITEQKVVDELSAYDPRIQSMLSEAQWQQYDTAHRDYWIGRIYAGLKKDLRERDRLDEDSSSGGILDAPDRSDGAFGSNGSGRSADPDDR